MYVANHYVKIAGKLYVKGEVIREELREETEEWLVKTGAIEKVAPVFHGTETETETGVEGAMNAPEYDPEEECEEEAEIEDEPFEIDATEGIVQEEEKKPARKAKRATGRGGNKA